MQCVYIAVFCLLALSIQTGAGLRCWSCASSSDRHCGDPFNKTFFHLRDCDSDRSPQTYNRLTTPVCKKLKQLSNEQEVIERTCVWNKETACAPSSVHTSVKDVFCETCAEDGCNSAERFASATLMVLLPTFLWALAAKFL
ncbi:uncharacterized protein LOC110831084 [Zootermopsis nevadensis]|uniref:Uncharacterized protein n=1 Tax=Zootermopsis nevadensis TaxID=136037 RepID=A0A067R4K6_ZOONE|nr:uncharacterized protein LOC110831084 [Zootermopsis nevadensis]KDR18171.1 hypothetical protein L798_06921 [Zootermopsis nevadensis]